MSAPFITEDDVTITTPAEALAELDRIERELGPCRALYRARDELREWLAGAQGPLGMPRPSRRTATQEKVARCPRCGCKDAA